MVWDNKEKDGSWSETFAVFWMLYAFFWVIPRHLNFICRRFGTLRLFHLHRQVPEAEELPRRKHITKRWLKQVLKNARKREKVARNPKMKDCGKMEGNGEACSSIKLHKTEPMIYSTGTAKTQQLQSGGRAGRVTLPYAGTAEGPRACHGSSEGEQWKVKL